VRRALTRVNGRGAEVLEQTRESGARTWVSPSHGTGRTCRAARPSAVVGRAENRAGAHGAENARVLLSGEASRVQDAVGRML
jgi:hypothetical protein